MKKKTLLGLGLCTLMLVALAGCTQPTENGEQVDPKIQAILDAGKLIVGTSADWEPMEFVNESTNEIEGFDVDFAAEIANALGVELEMKNIGWDTLISFEALNNGEIDMILSAVTWTSDRAEDVLFSNAYLNAGQVIIVNASNEDIDGPSALENKTVGVQINSTGETEALTYTGNASLVINYGNETVNFDTAATAALLAGEIDAIVMDNVPGKYLVKNAQGLKVVGNPFTDEFYAVAVKKGEIALRDEINKVIAAIQASGSMANIENMWL